MKKKTHILALLLVLIPAVVITACGSRELTAEQSAGTAAMTETLTSAALVDSVVVPKEDKEEVALRPLAVQTATQTATTIQLNGNSAVINGSGASANGSVVTINRAGIYTLSGTLTDGQVIVDVAGNATTVQLILDGVDITSSNSAPIYSKKAGETILTLEEGSANALRDGASYSYSNAGSDEPDAAIFAKNDLRINGTGTLEVTGSFNNGIGSKDDLVIESGNLRITAANHGIRGRDSLTVTGGTLHINAGNDGLQSNNDEDADKGWIALQGGVFDITSVHDGIQAETKLSVSGGTLSVKAGGGHSAAAASSEESYKGLKAGGNIEIAAGTIRIDSLDDSVHSNRSIKIAGGNMTLATGDDGIHADDTVVISGGSINITDSFEGIEGAVVEIQDGIIDIISRDDGLNAAGDSNNSAGQFGQDRFARNDNWYIKMDGGRVFITASGDGIDSNGNLYMNGGTLLVSGPASGYNPAIDYDWGSFTFTGGILAAAGGSGMASAPSEGSSQPALMVYFNSVQPEGTLFSVLDANGKVVIAFLPPRGYENMVISSPALASGQRYSVYTGGTIAGEEQDGVYLGGTLSGATKLFDITLSDSTTYVDNTGAATGNRMQEWGWGGR